MDSRDLRMKGVNSKLVLGADRESEAIKEVVYYGEGSKY